MIKSQQNPRLKASAEETKNKAFKNFAAKFYSGDFVEAASFVDKFKKSPKALHYGMLVPFVHLKDGLSQRMCKIVFGMGSNGWKIAQRGDGPKKASGGSDCLVASVTNCLHLVRSCAIYVAQFSDISPQYE